MDKVMDKAQEVHDRIEFARSRLDVTSADQVELMSLRSLVLELEAHYEELHGAAEQVIAFCQTVPPARQKEAEREAWESLRAVVHA